MSEINVEQNEYCENEPPVDRERQRQKVLCCAWLFTTLKHSIQ